EVDISTLQQALQALAITDETPTSFAAGRENSGLQRLCAHMHPLRWARPWAGDVQSLDRVAVSGNPRAMPLLLSTAGRKAPRKEPQSAPSLRADLLQRPAQVIQRIQRRHRDVALSCLPQ